MTEFDFKASAVMLMTSALFWDVTWRLLGLLALEDGTDTLSRNVGKQLPQDAA
jgi:hypothetical protein